MATVEVNPERGEVMRFRIFNNTTVGKIDEKKTVLRLRFLIAFFRERTEKAFGKYRK